MRFWEITVGATTVYYGRTTMQRARDLAGDAARTRKAAAILTRASAPRAARERAPFEKYHPGGTVERLNPGMVEAIDISDVKLNWEKPLTAEQTST